MPDKSKKSRIEMIQTNSRDSTGEDSGESLNVPAEVQLPELPSAVRSLLGHFFVSGQYLQTGQGPVPLTWHEINEYIEATDADMYTWEKKILKKMSDAYCTEYSRASDPNRPAPYRKQVEETEVDQVAKAMRIKQGLSAFRKRKG